jgi:phosphate starvation-inducible protein PhoH
VAEAPCGPLDENRRQFEAAYDVRIARRGANFAIDGAVPAATHAASALEHFADLAGRKRQCDEAARIVRAMDMLGDAHAPENYRCL